MLELLLSLDWSAYLGVAAAFILAFDRLAKLTPTETDNKIVAAAQKLFALLGAKVEDNPGTPPE